MWKFQLIVSRFSPISLPYFPILCKLSNLTWWNHFHVELSHVLYPPLIFYRLFISWRESSWILFRILIFGSLSKSKKLLEKYRPDKWSNWPKSITNFLPVFFFLICLKSYCWTNLTSKYRKLSVEVNKTRDPIFQNFPLLTYLFTIVPNKLLLCGDVGINLGPVLCTTYNETTRINS